MSERPRRFVQGTVIAPDVADRLLRYVDLNALKRKVRSSDPPLYEALHSLVWSADAYVTSLERSEPRPADAISGSSNRWVDSAEAASRLGLKLRRVQQLAQIGALRAEQRSRHWFIDPKSIEEHRNRRAA